MEKKIQKIFMDELGKEVIAIKDVSKGLDQIVKVVESRDLTYVIKIPKKHVAELLMREYIACKKLKGLVPVPKVIAKTNRYIIEEFIKGEDLDEVTLNLNEKRKIYEELGSILRKINSVPMKGYGFIGVNGKGTYSTLKERVLQDRNKNLSYLRRGVFSKEDFTRLTNYLDKNDFYPESKVSKMLHFDFEDFNIKVDNKKVAGILDFGDLSAGPPAYDLARVFISHYHDNMFEYFLKGYGKIDLDEVKYYSVISLLWMLPYHSKYTKNNKIIKAELEVLRKII